MNAFARSGACAGAILGAVLLAVAAVWLLRGEGSGVRVLVAVWLWLLPVLGAFASLGWLLGWAGGRVRGGR